MKSRNIISILLVLTIIFTIMGGSLAYFTWQTSESQKTEVTFTVEKQFSRSADGGGNITSSSLVPTSCNSNNAIKRTIKVMPQITGTKTIYMDLWLDVKEIGNGLTNSNNLKYVLSTSSTSCETGIVSSGTFNGKESNFKVFLLSAKDYNSTTTDTYYLYIWLDKAETSTSTQNQKLSLSLNGECDDESNLNVAAPELDDGMIPVVIDNSGSETTIKTISKDDPSWYNYRKKEWANVVITTSESQSKYLNTSDVSVSEDDILAYYVWIPRYKYKIWATTTGTKEQTIEIVFEDKNTTKSTDTTAGSYLTHPAFTFGNDELNGFWVGKFETTGNATTPTVKSNIKSLRSQNVSTQFSTAQKFGTSTYGSTEKVNAHMMKNSEWGAVAYLSHSKYGKNEEIYINNSGDYYTGRSGGNVGGRVNTIANQYSGQTSTLQYNDAGYYTWDGKIIDLSGNIGSYASDRTLGTKASTTGNITGIYDMSGGSFERVMGNYNDTIGNAGFSVMPDSKYYDLYPSSIFDGNYNTNMSKCTIESCGGHALFETAKWYDDSYAFVYSSNAWFNRSSLAGNDRQAGVFRSSNTDGSAYITMTFRSVIAYIK